MLTTRRILPTFWTGRTRALALAGNRHYVNLTVTEALDKLSGQRKKTAWDYLAMPWANGRGKTTELYVSPAGSKISDASALWRISMAPVTEDGPFSIMPGYTRIITVLRGDGFRLRGGTTMEVRQGTIYTFSGANATHCELLNGPALDLNVVFRGENVRASLDLPFLVYAGDQLTLAQGAKETLIIICLSGKAKVVSQKNTTLRQYESIRLDPADGVGKMLTVKAFHSGCELAVVRITRK